MGGGGDPPRAGSPPDQGEEGRWGGGGADRAGGRDWMREGRKEGGSDDEQGGFVGAVVWTGGGRLGRGAGTGERREAEYSPPASEHALALYLAWGGRPRGRGGGRDRGEPRAGATHRRASKKQLLVPPVCVGVSAAACGAPAMKLPNRKKRFIEAERVLRVTNAPQYLQSPCNVERVRQKLVHRRRPCCAIGKGRHDVDTHTQHPTDEGGQPDAKLDR